MKKNLLSKILTAWIILLFIGVSNISTANDLKTDVDFTALEQSETQHFDDYKEIFTIIDAHVYGFNLKGISLLNYIELWGVDCTIDIRGYKYPLFPISESHFFISADHVIAPNFIGICYPVTVDTYSVKGFALGNIEWD